MLKNRAALSVGVAGSRLYDSIEIDLFFRCMFVIFL